jgi:hypothetical protein
MAVPSEARGIHQSDLIIRSAIIAALDDLRANPWLLDYAFASLPQDNLTSQEYGQREIDNAKNWFLSTKIPVFMSNPLTEPSLPAISITLMESNESDLTISDTHYVVEQDESRVWPALTATFTPSYESTTGKITVPTAIGDALVIARGQQLIDRTGKAHEIQGVIDGYTFTIETGANADFTNAVIKGKPPASVVTFESMKMKETYSIGCHVQGEQTYLTYLHTLLVFCLHRYKADLLEARGFERTQISSSDFRLNDAFGSEIVWSRHLNISGHVTQVWPGQVVPKVTATSVVPSDTAPDDAEDGWIDLDLDPLNLKPKK